MLQIPLRRARFRVRCAESAGEVVLDDQAVLSQVQQALALAVEL
jgi:hypothetical protein